MIPLKDRYMTISQAAKELGITRQTVSRWIREGKIEAEQVGREKLIGRENLVNLRCPTCGKLWIVPYKS
jgi:excisionase family DNA binding protein